LGSFILLDEVFDLLDLDESDACPSLDLEREDLLFDEESDLLPDFDFDFDFEEELSDLDPDLDFLSPIGGSCGI